MDAPCNRRRRGLRRHSLTRVQYRNIGLTQVVERFESLTALSLCPVVKAKCDNARLRLMWIRYCWWSFFLPLTFLSGPLAIICIMPSLYVSLVSIHFNVVFVSSSMMWPGNTSVPQKMVGLCSYSRRMNSVTTPKFPPPPRTPQNSSAFSFSFTVSISPLAVTRVTFCNKYLVIGQLVKENHVLEQGYLWPNHIFPRATHILHLKWGFHERLINSLVNYQSICTHPPTPVWNGMYIKEMEQSIKRSSDTAPSEIATHVVNRSAYCS